MNESINSNPSIDRGEEYWNQVATKISQLPFEGVSVSPELAITKERVEVKLGEMAEQYEARYVAPDVRQLDNDSWERLQSFDSLFSTLGEAFYEPIKKIVYLHECNSADRQMLIRQINTLTHELVHPLIKLAGYSMHLNEGFTQYVAQDIWAESLRGEVLTEEEQSDLGRSVSEITRRPKELGGVQLGPEDIQAVFTSRNAEGRQVEQISYHGRILERRLAGLVLDSFSDKDLVYSAIIRGDHKLLEELFSKRFGKSIESQELYDPPGIRSVATVIGVIERLS